MCAGLRVAVVAWALVLARAAVDKKYNITIGYLPSLTGELRGRQGLTISGAITLALEELNNSTEILPDVKIFLEWHDTKSDVQIITRLVEDMVHAGVVAFFGPEGQCYQEAYLAKLQNLPMLSYKCADNEAKSFQNIISMEPSRVQAMKPVISLLRYYRWNKFSILYEDTWRTAAEALKRHALMNNMTVNHEQLTYDGSKGWLGYLYHPIIQNTKNKTRIYVFLGSTSGLRSMMSEMDSQQLFKKGEYMVIFVDMNAYMPQFSLKYLTESLFSHEYLCPNFTVQMQNKAQSLLVVSASEPSSNFQQFTDQVRKYTKEEPFKFPDPFETNFGNLKKFVSISAAYLYDSVKLYAAALDDLIKEDTQNEELSYTKLMGIAYNGSRIVAQVIKKSPYQSVSGLTLQLDQRAVSEGAFSVLAFKSAPYHFVDHQRNSCTHTMVPVGHFQQNDRKFPKYKLDPRLPIDWADSVKPEDEPPCGYSNENCATGNDIIKNAYNLLKDLTIPI